MTTGMYVFAYACSLVLINHKQKRLCELRKGESNIQYSRAGDKEMEAISENFCPGLQLLSLGHTQWIIISENNMQIIKFKRLCV